MIYDPASGKVLVVCGDPGLLIPITPELDLGTGSADQKVELGGKPEFLAADGKGKAYINLVDKDQVAGDIFASCGDGTLTVVGEPRPGKFQIVQSVQTPRGARTTPLIASISPGTRLVPQQA